VESAASPCDCQVLFAAVLPFAISFPKA